MSMKNYEITAWNISKLDKDAELEWKEYTAAESLGAALEQGTRLFREAMPDVKASDYEVHASGPL